MLPPLSLSPSTSPRRSHAETALYISAHKKRCGRREGGKRAGSGLARAREVGRASRPAGLAGCGVGGHGHGPFDKEAGTNETSAWLAKEGKGQGEGSWQAATVARRVTARAWALLRQQPAAIGVPETNRRARDLRNNQPTRAGRPDRLRVSRPASASASSSPSRFPPRRGLSRLPRALLPRTPTTSVWVGHGCVWRLLGVGGVIIGRRAEVGERGG